ncbi:MAG TPA: glycosyltransferase family 4 protein [Candidatus Eisenbacteria bacterium]|nr:glycosyltransferase family 4 protein [Candidatus Eisenbacteria bacterium]
MRILLSAGVDLSLPGGLETHVLELSRHLTSRGHEVEILARPGHLPPHRLVAAPAPAGYDILHHHGGPWPESVAGPAHRVRTFHFSVAAKMETYVRMGRLRTLVNPANYRALAEERASLRRAGSWIAVSRALAEDLARLHRVESGRFHVIPNGASFDPPREGRDAWRRKHGIAPDTVVLLTIGRKDYVKGFDLLERVWDEPADLSRDVIWVTVGGGSPSRRERRIVTGPLPHTDVIEWIHAADLGAVPSYYEGGGIALLDMLAGGLYVLTHDVGVASDVVRSGQNGEMLPRTPRAWRQALQRVLRTPPGRIRNSIGDDYRWDEISARVETVYREAIMLHCRPCASSS